MSKLANAIAIISSADKWAYFQIELNAESALTLSGPKGSIVVYSDLRPSEVNPEWVSDAWPVSACHQVGSRIFSPAGEAERLLRGEKIRLDSTDLEKSRAKALEWLKI
jgi:hypothetical protein